MLLIPSPLVSSSHSPHLGPALGEPPLPRQPAAGHIHIHFDIRIPIHMSCCFSPR
jgi:hypothetical protein